MEFRNPFSNAKVIGPVEGAVYKTEKAQRGDRAYVMSRSELMEFLLCPQRWRRGFRRKDSEAMDWGTLIDCLALEPQRFESRYAIAPENYPVEPTKKDPRTEKPWSGNAIYCQEWKAAQRRAGRTVIDFGDYVRAKAAVKWLREDMVIRGILDHSQRSVMVTADYRDAATELVIPVKILIDVLPDVNGPEAKGLADLKTCESAHPRAWVKSINTYNYHVQGALYLDVYTAATGEDRLEFYHVVQESYEPWECGRKMLSSTFLELGRAKYLKALRLYAACLASGLWPSYDDGKSRVIRGWEVSEPEPYMVEMA